MFDRLLSTINYQDDLKVKRIARNDKILGNCYASNNDFLHGDELPLYVEVENEEEDEADERDKVIEQSIKII